MGRNNIYTLVLLFALTLATAVISRQMDMAAIGVIFIVGLSAIKFLLVAFNFMELKKAHVFWKILLLSYLTVYVAVILIVMV